MKGTLVHYHGERVVLTDRLAMPHASTFLWNRCMMIQPDCRGFAGGPADVRWAIETPGLAVELELSLPVDDAVELWSLRVRNAGATGRPPRDTRGGRSTGTR